MTIRAGRCVGRGVLFGLACCRTGVVRKGASEVLRVTWQQRRDCSHRTARAGSLAPRQKKTKNAHTVHTSYPMELLADTLQVRVSHTVCTPHSAPRHHGTYLATVGCVVVAARVFRPPVVRATILAGLHQAALLRFHHVQHVIAVVAGGAREVAGCWRGSLPAWAVRVARARPFTWSCDA